MTRERAEIELRSILQDNLMAKTGVSIHPETKFEEDLGLDSLDAIDLAIAIEDRLDINIEDEDIFSCKTFGQAVQMIVAKTN